MMAFYIAIVALLNLALGYALAVFLRSGRPQLALVSGNAAAAAEYDDQFDADEDEEDWEG